MPLENDHKIADGTVFYCWEKHCESHISEMFFVPFVEKQEWRFYWKIECKSNIPILFWYYQENQQNAEQDPTILILSRKSTKCRTRP